jgi:uncharacterized lipoprotein YbaY
MRRPLAVGGALLLVAALAGCARTVSMTPAPAATDTACAGVVVRLPQTLGSAERRETDAQGTGAWGDPVSVSLTCGVPSPGPTTLRCFTVEGVDWIERDLPSAAKPTRYVLTTFGRTPAVQVVIEAKRISSSDVLPAVSDAVHAAIPRTDRHCLPVPSATPTS